MKSLSVTALTAFHLSTQAFNTVVASFHGFQDDTAFETTPVHANSGRFLSMDDLFSASSYPIAKSSVEPKLGTELTQIYDSFVSTFHSFGPSSPQEEKVIAVDIAFKNVVDRNTAKMELSTVN
jgi:hypothetical protein